MDSTSIGIDSIISQPEIRKIGTHSHLFACFGERDVYLHLSLAAIDGHLHGVSRAVIIHRLRQILLVLNFFAVDGHDQVASQHDGSVAEICAFGTAAEAGLFGGAAGGDLHNEESVVSGQGHFLREFGADGDGAYSECWRGTAPKGSKIIKNCF